MNARRTFLSPWGPALAGPSAIVLLTMCVPSAQAPQGAQAAAPIDLTGYWVAIVNEDWRWRMVTPPKGDYASVPLSNEGRTVADKWTPEMDGRCEAYGAAGLMRMPTRLHITWQDQNTLKIETDAGTQTRLLHFTGGAPAASEKSRQGYSAAVWELAGRGGRGAGGGGGGGGFGPPGGAPPPAAPGAVEGRGGRGAGRRGPRAEPRASDRSKSSPRICRKAGCGKTACRTARTRR